MPIRILPSTLVNQIAAGEVVERPASVVKELVENAIDAGATSVEVTLVDGGKSLISISDNGKGMTAEELNLAVERHATSKLPDDNLFNINFLGFRGEALPSISSVARLTITTRTAEAENGWKIEVNGGEKSAVMPAAQNKGTRIDVRDLFYATPARLKFLKSSASETAQCVDILNRIALANPHISFYLTEDNKKKISLNACQGELFDARLLRLADVMGRQFGENSLLIDAARENLRISGYVSLPTLNKANSLSQYLFVNNRPVRDKLLLGAIKGAYQDVLASNRYPMCALFFDIDPAYVDVNVHPAKAEVRFYDNALVRGLLVSAIRAALLQGDRQTANTVNLEELVNDRIPDFGSPEQNLPEVAVMREHDYQPRPVFQSSLPRSNFRSQASLPELERLYSVKVDEPHENLPSSMTEEAGPLGLAKAQFHNTFIISQTEDSIILVDQHAAHEKVKYEMLMKRFHDKQPVSQNLMPPLIVTLTGAEAALLEQYQEYFEQLGFEIDSFGGSSYAMRAVPCDLYGHCEAEFLQDILDELGTGQAPNAPTAIAERIATMACKSAVKGNNRLSLAEMQELLEQLLTLDNPYHCPHGRPTMIVMTKQELERKFKRIV